MPLRPLPLVALALALTGCGPSTASPLLVTCDARSSTGAAKGQCQEWRGDKTASTNANVDFNVLCTSSVGGQVAMGTCPTDALGTCTKRPSVAERVISTFYYAPAWDAAGAAADCTAAKGTWQAK